MTMHNPPHLGGIVQRQCLEPLGLTVTEAVEGMGVTSQALSDLVSEKTRISGEMAKEWRTREIRMRVRVTKSVTLGPSSTLICTIAKTALHVVRPTVLRKYV